MPSDPRYAGLNARCRAAIAAAEAAAGELSLHPGPDARHPLDRVDPARAAEMERSLTAAVSGLTDPDPRVRLAAVSVFGTKLPPVGAAMVPKNREPVHKYPPEAAAAMLTLATSDPDDEVRQAAIARVPYFYSSQRRDRTAEKRLAGLALGTDDVLTRHLIFLGLMHMSGVPHSVYTSPKYMALPVVFDEFYVRLFLEPDVVTPPASPSRWWWPF